MKRLVLIGVALLFCAATAFALREGQPDQGMAQMEARCRADLAARLGVAAADIATTLAEAVQWPDASLGYPQPGMAYIQVITPGVRFVFTVGGKSYEYHTDRRRFVFGGGAPEPIAPSVPFKELVNNPAAYHGRTLTTEGGFLLDAKRAVLCETVRADGDKVSPSSPAIWLEGNFPPEFFAALKKVGSGAYAASVGRVRVVGLFESQEAAGQTVGYGPLGDYRFRLTVQHIEVVLPTATITVTELLNAPKNYDSRKISVWGFYITAFEVSQLAEDPSGGKRPPGETIWVTGDLSGIPLSAFKPREDAPTTRWVECVLTGIFRVASDLEGGHGFGHLGGCRYQLEVTAAAPVQVAPAAHKGLLFFLREPQETDPNFNQELWAYDLATSKQTLVAGKVSEFAWSEAGQWLLIVRRMSRSGFALVGRAGLSPDAPEQELLGSFMLWGVSVSPDGQWYTLLERPRVEDPETFVLLGKVGQPPARVTGELEQVLSRATVRLGWLPDSSGLLVAVRQEGDWDNVWLISMRGEPPVLLLEKVNRALPY